jgi:predicted nucleotidyltransferase
MDAHEVQLPERHRAVVDQFISACRADERVIAAFLGGSYARGTADASSDLDLYLITTDEAYADFFAARKTFLRQIGEPVFLEDFDDYGFDLLPFILSDGTEGELALAGASSFQRIHGGPHVVLLDRTGILDGVSFPERQPFPAEQIERLHRLVYWFWHDLSQNFITPLTRNQLWMAVGALKELRRACVELARLTADFTTAAEGYERVERAIPAQRLAALEETFSPPERRGLLRAAHTVVTFYREVALPLTQEHGITYPVELERVVRARLDALNNASLAEKSGD